MTAVNAAIGAAGFRLRGDAIFFEWTGRGAPLARLVCWALPGPIALVLQGFLWWPWAPLLAAVLWLGTLAPQSGLTMGRVEGRIIWRFWVRDAFWMTLRGLGFGGPAGLVLDLLGSPLWWLLLAAAPLMPLAYEIGYRIAPKKGTEIGEGIFGGSLLAFLTVACQHMTM